MNDDQSANDLYQRFAAYYDLEYAAHAADLEFYVQFALQAGGPILELGCGSGRVLRALADTGLELTGIDTSPSMYHPTIALDRRTGQPVWVYANRGPSTSTPAVAGDEMPIAVVDRPSELDP